MAKFKMASKMAKILVLQIKAYIKCQVFGVDMNKSKDEQYF